MFQLCRKMDTWLFCQTWLLHVMQWQWTDACNSMLCCRCALELQRAAVTDEIHQSNGRWCWNRFNIHMSFSKWSTKFRFTINRYTHECISFLKTQKHFCNYAYFHCNSSVVNLNHNNQKQSVIAYTNKKKMFKKKMFNFGGGGK